MKQVKVIASLPMFGQIGVECLFGQVFEVKRLVKDNDGKVIQAMVNSEDFGGQVILNEGEFEIV